MCVVNCCGGKGFAKFVIAPISDSHFNCCPHIHGALFVKRLNVSMTGGNELMMTLKVIPS